MCSLGTLWRFESRDAHAALPAKREYRDALQKHVGWEIDLFAANVVYTELVSNVARHTRGPIEIRLDCDGGDVLLKVADQGSGFALEVPGSIDPLSEGGRGLFLVSKYATALSVAGRRDAGTTVTARLRKKTSAASNGQRQSST
jgi:anti-sigma regulatory factor (Ser/Thr protein kinase)